MSLGPPYDLQFSDEEYYARRPIPPLGLPNSSADSTAPSTAGAGEQASTDDESVGSEQQDLAGSAGDHELGEGIMAKGEADSIGSFAEY